MKKIKGAAKATPHVEGDTIDSLYAELETKSRNNDDCTETLQKLINLVILG